MGVLECEQQHIAVAMRFSWQNFPEPVETTGNAITLSLFPSQCADVHEIQGGEQKTHSFNVAFDRDAVTEDPLGWCQAPLQGNADPQCMP